MGYIPMEAATNGTLSTMELSIPITVLTAYMFPRFCIEDHVPYRSGDLRPAGRTRR